MPLESDMVHFSTPYMIPGTFCIPTGNITVLNLHDDQLYLSVTLFFVVVVVVFVVYSVLITDRTHF